MNNDEILAHTGHRPFVLPQGPWLMKQGWNDLLFAHWPADEAELLPYIPQGLELDKWEGRPWVSVSPFLLKPLRVRGMPPLPFVRRFLELNVRTYVVRDGKPGICFLTLEASSRLAVAAARRLGRLPYRHAAMRMQAQGSEFRFASGRKLASGQDAVFRGAYRAAQPDRFHAQSGTLLHWLTERYCLYTADPQGRLYIVEIHHLPWSLQAAELRIEANSLTAAFGLALHEPPSQLTYTARLDVLFWPPRRV